MARAPAKQTKAEEKATIDRSRWQEGRISKTPPQHPDKQYVQKTRQIYLRAVERRLKRETILTGRQRDILFCIIGRLPNKKIAEKLNMSRQRVDQHIAALLKKTKEKDKVGLVIWAFGFGSYADDEVGTHLDTELKRAGQPCDCPRCSAGAARSAVVRQPTARR